VGWRAGLLARLVAAGDVERALATAGHADVRIRALPGPVTTGVVLGPALHSGEGYDSVLSKLSPTCAAAR
jgi:hypothetical protein